MLIDVVTTQDAFVALGVEWDRLARLAENIFLERSWLTTWLEIYGEAFTPWVLTARHEGVLVAALPLVAAKDLLWRRVEFMGAGPLTPNHLDIIALPAFRSKALEAFAAQLMEDRSMWDTVDLDKLPEGTDTIGIALSGLSAGGCKTSLVTSAVCPCVPLPDSYEQFTEALPRRLKRSLRYRTGRLRADHPNAYFHQAQTEDDVARAMTALERMSRARWQARGYRSSFDDPRFARFQRAYAAVALRQGTLRLHSLCVGDAIIGVAYNFRVGSCVQAYMTAFDLAWADYSPGSRVLARTIEVAIAEGASSLDLLEGCEEYKDYWATTRRNNVRLRAYNSTTAGALARLHAQARETTVVIARRALPEPVRLAVRRRLDLLQTNRVRS